jgi:hypothetical protein
MIKSLVLTGLILSAITAKEKQTLTAACIKNESTVILTINGKQWPYWYVDLGEETDEDYEHWFWSDVKMGYVISDQRLLIKTTGFDADGETEVIIFHRVHGCLVILSLDTLRQ